MYHFFRYKHEGYQPSWYVVNPVRFVETVLCTACLGLAIIMVTSLVYMSVVVKVTITVVAGAFTAITIIDLISHCYRNPIYWNTWALFAITGAVFFFLGTGLLVATYTGRETMLMIGEIFFAVTGIMFLLDVLLILRLLSKKEMLVYPEERIEMYEEEVAPSRPEPESLDSDSEPEAPPEELKTACPCSTPTKRSSISYGGTFPMGKDATPLPTPAPLSSTPSQASANRRKLDRSCPSRSQTLVRVSSARLQRMSDGKVYLADGTPLADIRLANGDLGYKDPAGVLYNREGIPIIPAKGNRIEIIKEVSRHQLTSSSLMFRNGEWYTPSGHKVPQVHMVEDGKLVEDNGTPLYEIRKGDGHTVYENTDGYLYSSTGIPIGYHADFTKDSSRVVETRSRVRVASDPYDTEDVVHVRSKETIRTTAIKPRDEAAGCSGKECHNNQHDASATEMRTASSKLVYRNNDGQLFKSDANLIYQSNKDVKPRTTPNDCCKSKKTDTFRFGQADSSRSIVPRSVESENYREGRGGCPEQSDYRRTRDVGPCMASRESQPCRKTPHREINARTITSREVEKTETSRSIKDSGSRQMTTEATVSSRTVAISTRMVPKQKPSSAPVKSGPQEPVQRACRSADASQGAAVHQQQRPQVVYHQFLQKPCACGKVHYQQVSTVHGTVSAATCPFYLRPPQPTREQRAFQNSLRAEPPQKLCRQNTEVQPYQRECACDSPRRGDPPEPADRPPLQTISECDCETDSTMGESHTESSSSNRACDAMCAATENVSMQTIQSVDSGVAQTSETRMVPASALQEMNAQLYRR